MITFCIPTFRRDRMLRRAVESVLSQTRSDFRVMVGDNANSAETRALVSSFHDSRLTYHGHASNLGLVGNWNYLTQIADGEYCAILEDDNFWDPRYLERTTAALEAHPQSQLCGCSVRNVRDDGGPQLAPLGEHRPAWDTWDRADDGCVVVLSESAAPHWLLGPQILSSAAVMTRRALRESPPFAPELPFCHDYLRWAQISLRFVICHVPDVLVTYTYHSGNAVAEMQRSRVAGIQMRATRRRILGEFVTQLPHLLPQIGERLRSLGSPAALAQLISALLSGAPEPTSRDLGRYLWRSCPDARSHSGHMRLASALGPWTLRHADSMDRLLGLPLLRFILRS